MAHKIATVLLWLLVLNLGIAFGAGLYESRIAVPEWIGPGPVHQWNAEAARRADTGLRFWVFVTTVPLTLITIANLAAAWVSRGRERRWWLAAAAMALLDRAFTFSYFVPTMLKLMREDGLAESPATAVALQWVKLNHVRHVIVLAAWLAALKALSLRGHRDL
jgi:hypothetical protein